MSKVYVYNDNIHPLEEQFKGNKVHIAAEDYWRDAKGQKLAMDIYEANDFRGQYHPVPFDGSGKIIDDAKYYKKIKMEPVADQAGEIVDVQTGVKCMFKECKHVSASPEELETHSKNKHPNADTLILPEEDLEIKKKAWQKK